MKFKTIITVLFCLFSKGIYIAAQADYIHTAVYICVEYYGGESIQGWDLQSEAYGGDYFDDYTLHDYSDVCDEICANHDCSSGDYDKVFMCIAQVDEGDIGDDDLYTVQGSFFVTWNTSDPDPDTGIINLNLTLPFSVYYENEFTITYQHEYIHPITIKIIKKLIYNSYHEPEAEAGDETCNIKINNVLFQHPSEQIIIEAFDGTALVGDDTVDVSDISGDYTVLHTLNVEIDDLFDNPSGFYNKYLTFNVTHHIVDYNCTSRYRIYADQAKFYNPPVTSIGWGQVATTCDNTSDGRITISSFTFEDGSSYSGTGTLPNGDTIRTLLGLNGIFDPPTGIAGITKLPFTFYGLNEGNYYILCYSQGRCNSELLGPYTVLAPNPITASMSTNKPACTGLDGTISITNTQGGNAGGYNYTATCSSTAHPPHIFYNAVYNINPNTWNEYPFTLGAGYNSVNISLSSFSSEYSYQLELRDNSNNLLWNINPGSDINRTIYNLPGNAVYKVRITAGNHNDNYRLIVTGLLQSYSTTTNPTLNASPETYTVRIQDSKGCYTDYKDKTVGPATHYITVQTKSDHYYPGFPSSSCNGIYDDAKMSARVLNEYGTDISNSCYYTWYTYVSGTWYQMWTEALRDSIRTVHIYNDAYRVGVRDNVCPQILSGSITFSMPQQIQSTISVTSTDDPNHNGYGVSCYGLSNGEITALPSAGSGKGFKYSWYKDGSILPGDTNTMIQGKPAGNYTLRVAESYVPGCYREFSTVITQPPALNLNILTSPPDGLPVSCFGDDDGKLTAQSSGGVVPHQIDWMDGSCVNDVCFNIDHIGSVYSGLSGGSYSSRVTDYNNCRVYATFNMPEPLQLDTFEINKRTYNGFHVRCADSYDGSVKIDINGGSPDYPLSVYSGTQTFTDTISDTINLTGLYIDTLYYLEFTDSRGCDPLFPEYTFKITRRPPPLSIKEVKIDTVYNSGHHITCYGLSNGRIVVTDTGGVYPHRVSIIGPVSRTIRLTSAGQKAVFDNLPAGHYQVVVLDTNDCPATDTITLRQPPPLQLTLQPEATYPGFDPVAMYNVPCNSDSGSAIAHITGGGNDARIIYWYASNKAGELGISDTILNHMDPGIKYWTDVYDINNCHVSDTIILTEPDSLKIEKIGYLAPACYNNSDGHILYTATGGVKCPDSLNYMYSYFQGTEGQNWQDKYNSDSADFTGSHDVYSIRVEDYRGCAVTDTMHIINRDTLKVFISDYTIPSCFGGDDGRIEAYAVYGKKFYDTWYEFRTWKDTLDTLMQTAPDTVMFTGLASGFYTVEVKDSFQCVWTDTARLLPPPVMELSLESRRAPTCYNMDDGEIIVKATGGYAPYELTVEHVEGFAPFDRIVPPAAFIPCNADSTFAHSNIPWNVYNTDSFAYYYFYIRDSHYNPLQPECTVMDTFVLPKVPRVKFICEAEDISCKGDSNGALRLQQVYGGTGDTSYWTYSWEQGDIQISTLKQVTALPAGYYNLQVTDSAGCSRVQTDIAIREPDEVFRIEPVHIKEVSMEGYCDGWVEYSLAGGWDITGFEYSLDGAGFMRRDLSGGPELFYGLCAGKHELIVLTPDGCMASDSFEINNQLPYIVLIDTMPGGFGLNNGYARVQAYAGTGSYTYVWTDPNRTQLPIDTNVAENLAPGPYQVFAIDGNNIHTDTVTFTIRESNEVALALDEMIGPSCPASADGYIRMRINNGTPPYTCYWKNAYGDSIAEGLFIEHIPEGLYTFMVTDIMEVTKEYIVDLQSGNPMEIAHSFVTKPLCNGYADGRIEVVADGGSGVYHYTWKDEGGDTLSATHVIDNRMAGTYILTVEDLGSSACFIEDTFILSQPDAIHVSTYQQTHPTCTGRDDGELSITAAGGSGALRYEWDGTGISGNLLVNIPAGDYPVSISDINNCVLHDTLILEDPLPILISSVNAVPPVCNGQANGELEISIANGHPVYLVQWPEAGKSGEHIYNLQAGEYRVEVTDGMGCTLTDTIALPEKEALEIVAFRPDVPLCYGGYSGSLTAEVRGGNPPYNYTWSGGKTNDTIFDINAGTYTLSIIDLLGCTTAGSHTLSQPEEIVITSVLATQPLCNNGYNGELSLVTSGGTGTHAIVWENGAEGSAVSGLSSGTYTVQITDEAGCGVSRTVYLGEPLPLMVIGNVTAEIPCHSQCNGEITLDVSGGTSPYDITWPSGGANPVEPSLCAGTYLVTVGDDHLCSIIRRLVMTQPEAIRVSSVENTLPTCYGDCDGKTRVYVAGGTGAYHILWENGQAGDSIYPICPGEYAVTITDDNGCIYTANPVLPEQVLYKISGIPDDIYMCTGQEKELCPGVWATYRWEKDGELLSLEDTVIIRESGDYSIFVVTGKGCEDNKDFNALVSEHIVDADFIMASEGVAGMPVEAIDITWPESDSIKWYFGSGVNVESINGNNREFSFPVAGEYVISMVAKFGECEDMETKYITIYNSEQQKQEGERPVDSISWIEKVVIYPNPSDGNFMVNIELAEEGPVDVAIYNYLSASMVVSQSQQGLKEYQFTFSLTSLAPAVYALRVTSGSNAKTYLFVINR